MRAALPGYEVKGLKVMVCISSKMSVPAASLGFSAILLSSCFQAATQGQRAGGRHGQRAFLVSEEYGARYWVVPERDASGGDPEDQARFWWTGLPWDKDDAPFVQARAGIDSALRAGANPASLAVIYHAAADADKQDALTFYRWMYAAWLARKRVGREEGEAKEAPVADRVFRLDFPRTYSYARLAFLTQAFMRPSRYQDTLGKRLLTRNPQDEDVRFYMVRVASVKAIVPRLRDEARRESRAYLSYFLKKYPRNGLYDREEAVTLEYLWRLSGHPGYYVSSIIAAYSRYLKKCPNAADRKAVKAEVLELQRTKEFSNWYLAAVEAKRKQQPEPEPPAWYKRRPRQTREWFRVHIAADAAKKR